MDAAWELHATDEGLPSLVTHGELNALFHEFGHIMNSVSYVLLLTWEIRQNTQTATAQALLDLNAFVEETCGL